jgi:hypothetical protein
VTRGDGAFALALGIGSGPHPTLEAPIPPVMGVAASTRRAQHAGSSVINRRGSQSGHTKESIMTLRRSLTTLAALCALLASQASQAVALVPGVVSALPGTSVAAEPPLAGLIIEDKMLDFSMTTGKGLVSGQVQSRVVRSSVDGTLDFYWRVLNDASSLDDVAFFRIGLFNAPEYNANFRIDGIGDRAPLSAFRFTGSQDSFVNFDFTTQTSTGHQRDELRRDREDGRRRFRHRP